MPPTRERERDRAEANRHRAEANALLEADTTKSIVTAGVEALLAIDARLAYLCQVLDEGRVR